LVSKARVYFAAARPFAWPWVIVNAGAAVALAHGSLYDFLMASLIVVALVTVSHYVNNWRDYVRGVDRPVGGSTAKNYTAASQLIPSGLMTVGENKALALTSQAIGTLAFLFVPHTPWTIGFFLLGTFLSWTYTDLFKPRGIGEVALFLGHGFGTAMFAYSLVRPPTLTAASFGVLVGLWAAFMLTLDQYPDVKASDLERRVKSMASLLAGSQLSPGQFLTGAATMIYVVQVATVLLHWLPLTSLATVVLLPLIHLDSMILENNYGKGMTLFLVTMMLYPLLVVV